MMSGMMDGTLCEVCTAPTNDTPGYPIMCPECLACEVSIFESLGYVNIRRLHNRTSGIQRFMYTVGICHGLFASGYAGRYCFDNLMDATIFHALWDGVTPPEVGVDGCTAIK